MIEPGAATGVAPASDVDGDLAEVLLYSLPGCGSCFSARRLLRRRGIDFEEVGGAGQPDFRRELQAITGGATVPQVVIDEEPIGGADSLFALDRLGVLVPLARRESFPFVLTRRRGLFRRRREVVVLERDGTVLARQDVSSAEQEEEVAASLRSEFSE